MCASCDLRCSKAANKQDNLQLHNCTLAYKMNDNFDLTSSHIELPLQLLKVEQGTVLSSAKLDAIRKHLERLPNVSVMTPRRAITALLPAIKKLQGRGYTVDQIAGELAASGLPTSSRTLARLLSTKRPAGAQPTAKN